MFNPKTGQKMTIEEMEHALKEQIKVNTQLKSGLIPDKKIGFKVSPKTGAVCAYGLGRWPTTLYKRQWQRLLAQVDELKAFLETVPDDASVEKDEVSEAA